MNDQADKFDQADEDILTSTIPDEALEAAAGPERRGYTFMIATQVIDCC
jgi:hypothetical protein